MIFKELRAPSKDHRLELNTIIAHCPLARNFLHLGCHDGLICQIMSSFVQFEQVIGLDHNPQHIASCLFRKKHLRQSLSHVHFYFHHFEYPFREIPTNTVAYLSSVSLDMASQYQLCHWLNQTRFIVYIVAMIALPLLSKDWAIEATEYIDDRYYYIYKRNKI